MDMQELSKRAARLGQQAMQAAADELNRLKLELSLPGLIALEDRPWTGAEGAVIEKHNVRIEQELLAQRDVPLLRGSVIRQRGGRRESHCLQVNGCAGSRLAACAPDLVGVIVGVRRVDPEPVFDGIRTALGVRAGAGPVG